MFDFLANAVLVLHVGFVIFIVAGLPLILVGGYLDWAWVRNPWFRLSHLMAIAIVVIQAWLGVVCSLTALELWLRMHAGAVVYQGSFIQYWLQRLLYYEAPAWVFIVAYSMFGFLILLSWWIVPPRFHFRKRTLPNNKN